MKRGIVNGHMTVVRHYTTNLFFTTFDCFAELERQEAFMGYKALED